MRKTRTGNRTNMKLKQINNFLPILLLATLIGLSTIWVASTSPSILMNWFNNDDGFFYFKVAQNIVAGKGVTFDGINPTNGFHPLWMLVCIPIFLIQNDLILPLRVVVVVFGIIQFGSAIALFDVLKKKTDQWIALFLTISFVLSWLVYNNTFTGGLESALSFLFMILVWRQAIKLRENPYPMKREYLMAGVLAGLTVLARLDNFIFIGFLSIWLLFTRKRDAAILLLDALVALIIVVVVGMKFIGFRIHPHALFILITLVLLLGTGILALYFSGMYSIQQKWTRKLSVYVRGLLAGVVAAGGTGLIILIFRHSGLLERYSRMVLLVTGLLWIVYTTFVRSSLASRCLIDNSLPPLTVGEQWKKVKIWLGSAILYAIPLIILVGGYMLWSQINFGTPMPVSGQIKQWWGSLGATVYGSPITSLADIKSYGLGNESPFALVYQLFDIVTRHFQSQPYASSYAAWGIIGIAYLLFVISGKLPVLINWWDHFGIIPLLLATIYRVTYFYVSGYVHMRTWYWTVETFFLFLIIAVVVITIRLRLIDKKHGQIAACMIAGFFAIAILSTTAMNLFKVYPPKKHAEDPGIYLIIPQMLENMTPPGSVIGTPGGGTVSYFITNRTIVNLDGLMNSKEYFQALRKGDTSAYLRSVDLNFVYSNKYTLLETMPYQKVFSGCVSQVGSIFKKSLFTYDCN